MASTEEAFVAAIRAAPDDDTVRLVYADWLQDQPGRERDAERIRAMIGGQPTDARPGDRFYPPAPHESHTLALVRQWRRGFPESIACTAAWWGEFGGDVYRLVPVFGVEIFDLHFFAAREEVRDWPELYKGVEFTFSASDLRPEFTRRFLFQRPPLEALRAATGRVNARQLLGYPAGSLRLVACSFESPDARSIVDLTFRVYAQEGRFTAGVPLREMFGEFDPDAIFAGCEYEVHH